MRALLPFSSLLRLGRCLGLCLTFQLFTKLGQLSYPSEHLWVCSFIAVGGLEERRNSNRAFKNRFSGINLTEGSLTPPLFEQTVLMSV